MTTLAKKIYLIVLLNEAIAAVRALDALWDEVHAALEAKRNAPR